MSAPFAFMCQVADFLHDGLRNAADVLTVLGVPLKVCRLSNGDGIGSAQIPARLGRNSSGNARADILATIPAQEYPHWYHRSTAPECQPRRAASRWEESTFQGTDMSFNEYGNRPSLG